MPDEQDIYEYTELVIHGPKQQAISQGYTQAHGGSYTSHNGNPAFCMHLKVSDFYRNADKSVGFTIYIASLRDLRPQSRFFDYPFTVYASVLVGDVNDYGGNFADMLANSTPYSKVELFNKPWYGDNYSDSQRHHWSDGHYKLAAPVELSAPNSQDKKTYIVISILSICNCAQKGIDTPVYIDDISEYIPPPQDGYVWRKFGTNAQEDPAGNTINPQKLDGNWHLVKPLYMTDVVGSGISWVDVDGGVPID